MPIAISVFTRNLAIPASILGILTLFGTSARITSGEVLTLAIPTASICAILAVEFGVAEQEMISTFFE